MNTVKQISVVVRHVEVPVDSALYNMPSIEIPSPGIVADMVRTIMGDMDQEYFCAIPVDAGNKILGVHLVHLGAIESCMVDYRSIYRSAVILGASHLIIAHNHPADQMEPSEHDVTVTKNMYKVGLLLGVYLLDHVIIGRKGYYSFAENKKLFEIMEEVGTNKD